MKFQKSLVLLLCLSCWLSNGACLKRQVPEVAASPAAGLESQNRVVPPQESDTEDYIDAWNFPIAEDSGEAPVSEESSKERRRQLKADPDDTEEYLRAWSAPVSAGDKPEKSSTPFKERRRQLQAEPDDTDEYIRGWTFE